MFDFIKRITLTKGGLNTLPFIFYIKKLGIYLYIQNQPIIFAL